MCADVVDVGAGECWAGNSLGGKVIDESKCNMPCNADKGFLCGGPDALTVSRSLIRSICCFRTSN